MIQINIISKNIKMLSVKFLRFLDLVFVLLKIVLDMTKNIALKTF